MYLRCKNGTSAKRHNCGSGQSMAEFRFWWGTVANPNSSDTLSFEFGFDPERHYTLPKEKITMPGVDVEAAQCVVQEVVRIPKVAHQC
eukprot:g11571.t1